MKENDLKRFKIALQNHRETLLGWLKSDAPEKEVHLSGTGNDAVKLLLSELKGALQRVDSGDFGKCEHCNGEIEKERLEADYTCCTCLNCYTDAQLRTLESELALVARVQKDLLPCKVPEVSGMEIAVYNESAGIVGGDYYDFYKCHSGVQGFVIADVMHKGLPASMLMSNLQASLRILGPEVAGLDALALRLNSLFKHNLNLIRFISIFLGTIDPSSKTMIYCNAGHHPPLRWNAKDKEAQWLCPTGPALGLAADPQYSYETVRFNSGDIFVFYTDGLVEAQNNNGQTFDEKRLAVYVRNHLNQSANEILEGVLQTAKSTAGKFHDDVTLMVLKVQ